MVIDLFILILKNGKFVKKNLNINFICINRLNNDRKYVYHVLSTVLKYCINLKVVQLLLNIVWIFYVIYIFFCNSYKRKFLLYRKYYFCKS